MSRGIQWGKMAYELRHEVSIRNDNKFPEDARLSMHPEDLAELYGDVKPSDTFFDPGFRANELPRLLGMELLANDLLPIGVCALVTGGQIVALVNLDEVTINARRIEPFEFKTFQLLPPMNRFGIDGGG